MTQVLTDRPDEGVTPLVSEQAGFGFEAGTSRRRRAVRVKFIEETGEAETQAFALIADASHDLCQRARSGRDGRLPVHKHPTGRLS